MEGLKHETRTHLNTLYSCLGTCWGARLRNIFEERKQINYGLDPYGSEYGERQQIGKQYGKFRHGKFED